MAPSKIYRAKKQEFDPPWMTRKNKEVENMAPKKTDDQKKHELQLQLAIDEARSRELYEKLVNSFYENRYPPGSIILSFMAGCGFTIAIVILYLIFKYRGFL